MAGNRRFSICFSGVGTYDSGYIFLDQYHDGQMYVDYAYLFSTAQDNMMSRINQLSNPHSGVITYNSIFGLSGKQEDTILKNYSPVIMNFDEQARDNIASYQGLYSPSSETTNNKYSFYRREYEIFKEFDTTTNTYIYKEYKSEWEPVLIDTSIGNFRDFNIQCDKTYQYICYSANSLLSLQERQSFANYDGTVFINNDFTQGDSTNEAQTGSPVVSQWQDWSIVELIPEEKEHNIPLMKNKYQVNLNQMWFFKYNLETGAQTQNISRNEVQTLGQYPKIGFGAANNVSGSVSAFLGSEIRPYMSSSYIERMWYTRGPQPLSTNDRVMMLNQWRALVASKNPKLLRDNKGQAWIVQIMSGENTPKTTYYNQPDSISFQWRQVASVDNVVIYGNVQTIYSNNKNNPNKPVEKIPMFKTGLKNL